MTKLEKYNFLLILMIVKRTFSRWNLGNKTQFLLNFLEEAPPISISGQAKSETTKKIVHEGFTRGIEITQVN